MPPFINFPGPYPRETPAVGKGLLDNPTVTPSDKVIYVAGIIFTFLCLLVDIGMLAYLGFKMYRLCLRLRTGVSHDSGGGVAVEHEEKGLLIDGDNGEEDEQLPAYYERIDGETDEENNSTITSYGAALSPSFHDFAKVNDNGVEESVSFPLTWSDFRDKGHIVQILLDHISMHPEQHTSSITLVNQQGSNKENVKPAAEEVSTNGRVVSPTSKAAHVSPHGKDCLACRKLSPVNSISSSDYTGRIMESVTFPLTWNDMREHGALIKWFLENHNLKDFIHAPNEHYTFDDRHDAGFSSGDLSPTSKAAHLSPHENCDYCIGLARADKISVSDSDWDWDNKCLTFPLTMDDMLEHKDSILAYLPDWSKSATLRWETPLAGQNIHFDEDIRLKKEPMEAWT
ncbi:MAG: hypothetical protein Q9192_003741 [Flavoplaca navasiana]